MKKSFTILMTVAALAFGAAGTAFAQEADVGGGPVVVEETVTIIDAGTKEAPAEVAKLDTGDTAWMLTSTMLVILMTIPGLALFYGGLARAKNMLSVLMHVFVIFCLTTTLWFIYGYSLAFSNPE
ncbi:MAG: ammonia channel protein, partial [Candidatus Accumulibacter sp.]|nr:ammonia channel protein [Accumulibacter sp.]